MKNKKLVILLIVVLILLIIVFCSKNLIIKQYFISKLKNTDYNNYICSINYNGKNQSILYCSDDSIKLREYNESGNLSNYMYVTDLKNNESYVYDMESKTILENENPKEMSKLELNKDFINCATNENAKFKYKGTSNVNNVKCYVLSFTNETVENTFYIDTDLLYTVKSDAYTSESNEHVVFDYNLDFELSQKNLFE